MNKPFLTPENVMQYQSEGGSLFFKDHLNKHMEINSYIEHLCGSQRLDGGGEYANWLNSLGFHHQTDQGWWNQSAVDIDNIELFVEWYKHDPDNASELMKKITARIECFKNFKKLKGARVDMIEHHAKVAQYVEG